MGLESFLLNSEEIKDLGLKFFDQVGFSSLHTSISIDQYRKWLEEEKYGNMNFLKEHLSFKEKPQNISANLNSAILVTKSYFPHPKKMDLGFKSSKLKIASYAQGEDYHHWLKKDLERMLEELKKQFPEEEFLCFTDSGPVLERDLAYRAGLGWIGKNTCLIHSTKGSLFFIGEILTSLKLDQNKQQAHPDRCGKCTRCIDACPTDALTERSLDATKCISYLSIEHKTEISSEYNKLMGPWFYGCDICQAVCPWNEKLLGQNFLGTKAELGVAAETALDLEKEDREVLIKDIKDLLGVSNKKIQKRFFGSPMNRANANMHKRNAIRLALYFELSELIDVFKELANNTQSQMLKSYAEFAVNELVKNQSGN